MCIRTYCVCALIIKLVVDVSTLLLPCVLWALFERYVLVHSPSIHVVDGGGSPVMHTLCAYPKLVTEVPGHFNFFSSLPGLFQTFVH